jgi:hypothetical protein
MHSVLPLKLGVTFSQRKDLSAFIHESIKKSELMTCDSVDDKERLP